MATERTDLNSARSLVDVEFRDVTFTAKNKKGVKQIIKGVSGKFICGQLSAIMGPSGAGKSSLLNILTGYQVSGTQGTITFDSPSLRKNGVVDCKKQSCYILQDDALPSFFTVQETMMMCCNLKVANLSTKSRKSLIDDILNSLGLVKCRNTRCQNLSGGQKKRVSIALELVGNPSIMFLDEPTTGLDSSSASQCVRMLKSLARAGRTIVCTIHQPNASLYSMFDYVYVMAEGKCVYQGATSNTVEYLASYGFQCPQYHNPADYILEVVSGEYGDCMETLSNAAKDDKWRGPHFGLDHLAGIQTECVFNENSNTISYEAPSEWTKFNILVKRNGKLICRDWSVAQMKIFLSLLVGVGVGLTYQSCGRDASKAIYNLGFLLASLVFLTFTSIMPSVLKFPSELVMLKKENFNNWYNLKTYYAAYMLWDIPFQSIFSFVYCVSSYFISDQPNVAYRFFMVLLIQILTSLTASGFGLILGSLFNPINGTFFGSIALAMMICLGGFLIQFPHMSSFSYMFTYLSFISFAIDGVMQAVYGFNQSPLICAETEDYCQFTSPHHLLKDIGMGKPNYWIDVAYLFVNFLVFRTIAFCALRKRVGPL